MTDKEVNRKLDKLLEESGAIRQHLTDLNGSIHRHEGDIRELRKGQIGLKVAVLGLLGTLIVGFVNLFTDIFK